MVQYVLITNHHFVRSEVILQNGGFFCLEGVIGGEVSKVYEVGN